MLGAPQPYLLSSEVDSTLGTLSQPGLCPSSQRPSLEQKWQGLVGVGGHEHSQGLSPPRPALQPFSFSASVGSGV